MLRIVRKSSMSITIYFTLLGTLLHLHTYFGYQLFMQTGCKQGGVAVMASLPNHLSGGRVNLAILRESYRRELLECLDKCQGSKVTL